MLATLTTLVFICAPVSAPGLTVPLEQPQDTEIVDKGYTGQILLVDAVGIATIFAAGSTENEVLAWAGVGVLAAGPAVVHAKHGRSGEAIASLAMRPALTIGGIYAGAKLGYDPNCDDLCGFGEAIIGGMAGYGLAVIIDSAYLARTKRTTREANWMPTINATSSSVQLGLGGRF